VKGEQSLSPYFRRRQERAGYIILIFSQNKCQEAQLKKEGQDELLITAPWGSVGGRVKGLIQLSEIFSSLSSPFERVILFLTLKDFLLKH
jgi:hypothetical protein